MHYKGEIKLYNFGEEVEIRMCDLLSQKFNFRNLSLANLGEKAAVTISIITFASKLRLKKLFSALES